eukprot:2197652-Pleurochrysis_carterae.AAC.1
MLLESVHLEDCPCSTQQRRYCSLPVVCCFLISFRSDTNTLAHERSADARPLGRACLRSRSEPDPARAAVLDW